MLLQMVELHAAVILTHRGEKWRAVQLGSEASGGCGSIVPARGDDERVGVGFIEQHDEELLAGGVLEEAHCFAKGDVLWAEGRLCGGGGIVANVVTVDDAKAQGDICGSEGGD